MGDVIFSLDIGTRNVVGVLAKLEDSTYKVVDCEIMEHPDRAMYDGQIHDIEKVSEVVKAVKARLEERNEISLKYVSIAAAGRALKTQKVLVENEVDFTVAIDRSHINSLELHGIQTAQKELEKTCNDIELRYYCVGYTVINYYLDDSVIGNLTGHKGNKISAEILATFLPHIVVDSLYTVVHNSELEVISLTLEPIAAINIAIPPKFRLLNLALVDIGAGTSDIAITKSGTITSYAMVSFAGDKITEALSNAFLLDFITAEKLKIELSSSNHHRFNDIVGIEYNLSTEEIVLKIEDIINELSEKISEKMVEYNGKPPSAVFCIGGGSQVPKLRDYLSEGLGLPKERVVIRGTETLENVEYLCQELKGPEFITPLGIGYTACKDREQDFLEVNVNGKSIRLFNSKELSVSDALILISFNARKLIAKKGKSISIEINGEKRVIHGDYGEAATIYVNSKAASLDTKLKNNDSIVIEEATEGKGAAPKLKNIVNINEEVTLNGKRKSLIEFITVNESSVNGNYILKDRDKVNINRIETARRLLEVNNINPEENEIIVNEVSVEGEYKLENGDVLKTKSTKTENKIEKKRINIDHIKNGLAYIDVNVNGKKIRLNGDDKQPMFVEIFNHIDFDITNPKGILELKLNGQRANYTDMLKNGDLIEIFWR